MGQKGVPVRDRFALGTELRGYEDSKCTRGLGKHGQFYAVEYGARRKGRGMTDQRNVRAEEAFEGIRERMWACGEFAG